MTNLIEVARNGRANALARIGGGSPAGSRSRSGVGHGSISFSSVRGRI